MSLLQRRAKDAAAQRNALVGLIWGGNSEELVGFRTAMASARRHGSTAEQVVITPTDDQSMPQGFRDVLISDGVKVVDVPPIPLPVAMQSVVEEHWRGVLTKFGVFNL